MTSDPSSVPGAPAQTLRRPPSRGRRKATITAWLFIAPAGIAYAAFVLVPLAMSVYYSLLRWDGIGEARFHGLTNYITVLTDSDLLQIIGNAFQLVLYFTLIPVLLGLAVASAIRGHMAGRFGTATRTILFLPQVIPLVAAGIAWSWM
ncbi:MAG: sugar ABC transporter permease, partial [Acetobacteraceae bacterium]